MLAASVFISTSVRRAVVLAFAVAASGCAQFGFTGRVLHRVPSPDGQLVAVCQEIPEFDGPSFSIRLEQQDGTVIRTLYEIGDGDPCSEIAWAPDGQTLAVLSDMVARMRFVDVAWVLANTGLETSHWSWRDVSLAGERDFLLGRALRFTGASEVELELCPYSLAAVQRTGQVQCASPAVLRQVMVPRPIYTGHLSRPPDEMLR